jgi:FtsZ-interacting cell division protein ZipA
MRLKYFLRGLGIGIVVTTIILAISHNAGRRMSDSEVIERAKELGMAYTTAAQENSTESAADTTEPETDTTEPVTTGQESPTDTEAGSTAETESSEASTTVQETTTGIRETTTQQETTTQETTTQETTATRAAQESTTETTHEASATEAETTQAENESTETEASTVITYTLTIASGMSSNTVCDILKKNGIIADSGDFDRFLVSNGYADRIRVGSFEVNSGMSYDELAAVFCSR